MGARVAPRRFVILLLVVLMIGPLWIGGRLGSAATPPSGTVGPSSPTLNWAGMVYPVQATVDPATCPPEADPGNLRCDHFILNVDVAPDYWDTHTGGVEVVILWAEVDDDFDMYVYDAGGLLVAQSTGVGGTGNTERAFVDNAAGAYEVRVVPFTVTASGYAGTATFMAQAGGITPNPPRGTGGLAFGPATVIDAQRTEGEPINYVDARGRYWESGPWGTSTQQSFIHKSNDDGDQFNIVSPIGLRPNPPPGGGDTDIVVDDAGTAYFTDLEGLVKLDASVSNDGGNTWRKNPAVEATSADDRQWFAVDNGTNSTSAADNTVFLVYREAVLGSFIYSTPGSTGPTDPIGGLVYTNAADTPTAINSGAPCGQMRFDRVKRNLYYACADGDHIQLSVAHVDVGQRTNLHFETVATPASPGGLVGDIFPAVAVDRAGFVYAVWVDENDHNVYYAWSNNVSNVLTGDPVTWSAPLQINGGDANSNVFPWAQAGNFGNLVVAWYGSPEFGDSDVFPSWYNDRQGADGYPWYGYVSLVQNATSGSPTFNQQRFTDKPMHYGQICNGGLGCTISDGDRTMADFFAVNFDRTGAMRLVYNDTTSQHHGAHLMEVRQLRGPTAFGAMLTKPTPTNIVPDKIGDAQWPHYGPSGQGTNLNHLDFTRIKVTQPTPGSLRFQLTMRANLTTLSPPPGYTRALWLVRFQALSYGDQGEAAYRIFYVAMESVNGGAPTFFAGSGDSAQGAVPGDGCVPNTPQNCKVVLYPNEVSANGNVTNNLITITVPLQGGFGPNRPIFGNMMHSVTGFTFGRNIDTDIYADVDASPAFDAQLAAGTVPGPVLECDGRTVLGSGAIPPEPGFSTEAGFALSVCEGNLGKVQFRDESQNVAFSSTRITRVVIDDAAHKATILGTGILNGEEQVTFRVTVYDLSPNGATDRFGIRITSSGEEYAREDRLLRGNIVIEGAE